MSILNPGQDYGLVFYDIPKRELSLRSRLLNRLDKRAVRVNLSVYLFNFAQFNSIESLIEDHMKRYKEKYHITPRSEIYTTKIDPSDSQAWQYRATESFKTQINDIAKSIKNKVEVLKAKNKDNEEFTKLARYIKRKLINLETASFTFTLLENLDYIFKTVRDLFNTELAMYLKQKQLESVIK